MGPVTVVPPTTCDVIAHVSVWIAVEPGAIVITGGWGKPNATGSAGPDVPHAPQSAIPSKDNVITPRRSARLPFVPATCAPLDRPPTPRLRDAP